MKIVLGSPKSGKSGYIYEQVRAGASAGQRQIIIVPETSSHRSEKQFLKICGNSAALYGYTTTFTKLADLILKGSRKNQAQVSESGRALIMYVALTRVQSALEYYTNAALKPQLIEKLLAVTDEFKVCKIKPEQLMLAAEGADMPAKVKDIAKIYAAYCAVCAENGLDGKDKLSIATELAKESGVFENTAVHVDGFYGFTAQEYDLLYKALLISDDITVTLLYGEDAQVYCEQQKTFSKLKRLCERAGKELEIVELGHSHMRAPELDALSENLFRYECEPTDVECKAVKLYSTCDKTTEVQLVAALIRNAVLDGTIRYRDIAIACGDEVRYKTKLEAAMEKFEIPLYTASKKDILTEPPIAALLQPIAAIVFGMSITTMSEYIKTGFCGLGREDYELLENYMYTWNINSSKGWADAWTMPLEGYGREDADDLTLTRLNDIRERVSSPVFKLQEDFKVCKTGSEYADAFLRHIERVDYAKRIEMRAADLLKIGMEQEAAEYTQLFDIITRVICEFKIICAEENMSNEHFLRLLKIAFSLYTVGTIPVMLDSVVFSNFDRISTDSVKLLFVMGAVDGLLPPPSPQNGALTERERIMLETEGIELTQTQEERAFEGYSRLVHLLSAPSDMVVFSLPRAQDDGGECSESFVLKRARAVLPRLEQQDGDREGRRLMLLSKQLSFELACLGVTQKSDDICNAANSYYKAIPEKQKYLTELEKYIGSSRGPLKSPDLTAALFGNEIRLSASRLEKVASCRFSYFMQYGLRAKTRRRAHFGALEVGTFVHYVIENTIEDMYREPQLVIDEVAKIHIHEYVQNHLGSGAKSPRLNGILRNMSKYVISIVKNVYEELCCSDFVPLCFEMDFRSGGDAPELTRSFGNISVSVNGKIDRVDGYVKNGRLYIKVVDYKTGNKSFKLSQVYHGLNMQMFLYLLMVSQSGKSRLMQLCKEKMGQDVCDIGIAGALYIPAKAPFVTAESDESDGKVQAAIDRELRRTGLINSDPDIIEALEHGDGMTYRFIPLEYKKDGSSKASSQIASAEQFGKIIKKVEWHLNKLAAEIAGGDIEANPVLIDKNSSICTWCDFKAACHFDESSGRDKARRLAPMSDAEVFEKLDEEADCNGN